MTTGAQTRSPAVRPAAAGDMPALAAVLAAAFQNDPVFAWMFPDPTRRAELNPPLFRLLVDSFLPLGETYACEPVPGAGVVSAAVWVPPGVEPDPEGEAELAALFVAAAEEHGERAGTLLELMAAAHPSEQHAYLFILGTAPAWQGQGFGSAQLRHVTGWLDREGTAAYLEASSPENRRLYLRHGFTDVGTVQLPGGPPFFCMWREPC